MKIDRPTWRVWSLLVGTTALGVALSGCHGGTDQAAAPPTTGQQTAQNNGTGTGRRIGKFDPSMMNKNRQPGAANQGMTPMGAPPPAGKMAGKPGGPGAPKVVAKMSTPPRPDPFKPSWNTIPPPPPANLFTPPIRIALADSGTHVLPPGIEIQEVPNHRVSGIMTGNGVYALVEGPDGVQVVRPGGTLGAYRVASVNSDSITLKRTVGRQTYTQKVPLTGGESTVSFASGPGTPGGRGRGNRGGATPTGGGGSAPGSAGF